MRQLIFSFLNQSKVEINTDQFPSEEILRPYSSIERLDPLLESEIRSQTSTNEIGNRLVNFTRFWIDESSPGDTYSAFNLPFIQLDHKDKIPTSIYVRETSRYREGSEIKSNITKKDSSKLFRAISDWSTKDTPLKMDQVNQLRKLISKLIFTNIKFSLLPYNDQKTINAKSIEERIKFQGTANASNVKNSVIEIEKSSESALVLQAIVIGDENLYGDFDESELETYHSALSRAIDKWIDKIEILLTKERIDTLEDRFIRLIEMQVAFGTIRDTDSPDEILTKLFIQESRFENPVGTGEAMSVSKWTKYMVQAKSKIKDIQDKVRNEFGEGRTVPKLFEVGLVHPVIERFHRETRPNADVAANSIRISKEFSDAIEDTWSQLPEIIGFINSEIDPETEWHLQSEKICETANLAFSMSLINSKDTEKFNRLKYLSGVTQKFEIQGYAGMHGKLESKEANWLQKASLLSKIDLVLLQAVNEFIKVGIELTQMIEERIGVLAEGSARENTNQLALDNLLRGLCDLEEKLGD